MASANVVPAAHSALLCFAVPGGQVMRESLTCGGCDRKRDEAKSVHDCFGQGCECSGSSRVPRPTHGVRLRNSPQSIMLMGISFRCFQLYSSSIIICEIICDGK